MASTNNERVGEGLDLLRAGLGPFVERELKRSGRARELDECRFRLDAAVLLKLMWDNWKEAFRTILDHSDRSLVSELRDHRNKWAHQEPFSTEDAYRALDSSHRLLISVSAPQVQQIDALKREQLHVLAQEQERAQPRRSNTGAASRVPPPIQGKRIEQIQPLVRDLMRVILDRRPVPEEEIRNLMNPDYCKQELGIRVSNFPLVKEDRNPAKRYWKDQFAHRYYVCSQWWKVHHLHNAQRLRDYLVTLIERYQDKERNTLLRRLIAELEDFSRRNGASA